MNFNELLANDVKSTFLAEFSHNANYSKNGVSVDIRCQFFKDSLDKTETIYEHLWCDIKDVPNLAINDLFIINGTTYACAEFAIDEFNISVDVFLQEILSHA